LTMEQLAAEFNNHDLHSQAQSQVGDFPFSSISCCLYHAFNAAVAKATRDDYPLDFP
jgi:hypothetical protein